MKRLTAILLALLLLGCAALGEAAPSAPLRSSADGDTPAPVRTIASFYLCRMIEGGFASFSIATDGNEYRVSVDEGEEQPFSAEAVDELMAAIEQYDVAAWDGFDEADYNVEDGENFRLEIAFDDGTVVTAKGDNAFPDNYGEAIAELWRVLTWNAEEAQ